MQVAPEHSEAVGQRARVSVEEGLLLNGIPLSPADVSPGHVERSAAVVTHLADAGLSIRDGAAVPAGEAAYAIAIQLFVKIAFAHLPINDLAESSHDVSRILNRALGTWNALRMRKVRC